MPKSNLEMPKSLVMPNSKVSVICRFRPLNESEVSSELKFTGEETCILSGKILTFDQVFRPDATQEMVYNATAKNNFLEEVFISESKYHFTLLQLENENRL
jgi:hypothetical protein